MSFVSRYSSFSNGREIFVYLLLHLVFLAGLIPFSCSGQLLSGAGVDVGVYTGLVELAVSFHRGLWPSASHLPAVLLFPASHVRAGNTLDVASVCENHLYSGFTLHFSLLLSALVCQVLLVPGLMSSRLILILLRTQSSLSTPTLPSFSPFFPPLLPAFRILCKVSPSFETLGLIHPDKSNPPPSKSHLESVTTCLGCPGSWATSLRSLF